MLSDKTKTSPLLPMNGDGDVTEEYLMPHTKKILNIFYDTIDLTSLDINISYKENMIKSHIMGGNYSYIGYLLSNKVNTKNKAKAKINSKSFSDYENNNNFKQLNKHFKSIITNVNKIVSNESSSMK